MTPCFDVEVTDDVAKDCREWLQSDMGKPFWAYLERESQRLHDGVVNALTDNPINDILVGQRTIGAEQAIRSIKVAVDGELSQIR